MNKYLADLRAALHFFKEGVSNLDTTASFFPSSSALVEAMLQPVPLERCKCVVELGPGTGSLTKEILKRLPPDGHLHAIELDQKMAESTAKRIGDPRFHSIHGNALEAPRLLVEAGCGPTADAVISSLGLSIMGDELRSSIVRASMEILSREGTFMQYSYAHTRFFVMSPQTMYYRVFNAGKFLEGFFETVERKFIPVNAPPAFVYTCHAPRELTAASPGAVGRAARRRRHTPMRGVAGTGGSRK